MEKFPTIEHLISHRFRGFSAFENTIEGLESALDFGVQQIEFDVRASRCGTPVVYHDEYAVDKTGEKRHLHTVDFEGYRTLGSVFAHIPSLEHMLMRAAAHPNTSAKLLVDIKDFGLHEAIHALVCLYRLQSRVIYVSWLPEVLYALDHGAPDIPKCFSHWCAPIHAAISSKHNVHMSKDGIIPKGITPQPVGTRSGWDVLAPLQGDMSEMLKRCGGGVCVPAGMITRDLSDYYHRHELFVSAFSYVTTNAVRAAKNDFNIDYYFIDKKIVFDDLC